MAAFHIPRCLAAALIAEFSLLMACPGALAAAQTQPLVLESTIMLKGINGRLDHLEIDPTRRRLYVAELGSNSVGVVDLTARQVVSTVGAMGEPQGLGYLPSTDTLYVANGGDGSVRLLRGSDLHPVGRIELGEDADNVLVERASQRVYVGYGNGGIAVIDGARAERIGNVPLKAHPENFRIDPLLRQMYVNVPGTHEIAVIDLVVHRQVRSWSTHDTSENFPMALDGNGGALWVAFRNPARIVAYRTPTGAQIDAMDTCPDADDISLDTRRARLYVTCGAGEIDVLRWVEGRFEAVGRVATRRGARTSLFAPDHDRLYVAVPATLGKPAAIYVYRPNTR